MQTILVPTDFTEADMHTVLYAINFAKQTGASKIILFHAIDNYFESGTEANAIDLEWEFYSHVVKERQVELNAFRDKILQYDSSVPLETQCDTVRLRDAINDVCNELNIDVVITGRMHNDELTESLFGSNIIALANECENPLVIVPPDVTMNALNEILFAFDFNNNNELTSTPFIKNLLDTVHAKIYALHVEQGESDKSQPKQIVNEKLSALMNSYNAGYHNLPAEDFRLVINEFVTNKKIDIIITIPKKHGLFEGLFKKNYTKKLAFHTHVPLMILH